MRDASHVSLDGLSLSTYEKWLHDRSARASIKQYIESIRTEMYQAEMSVWTT